MAFVDQAQVELKAGKGGDGIVSFRHEKFVAMGGPFGGDGGHGGSIILKVDEGLRTLMDFRYNRHFKAQSGGNGGTKGMTGASADDRVIKVPQGTIVTDADTGEVLGDLVRPDQTLLVARGGRGGRGNIRFATPANPAPELSENGEPGQTRQIKLELRVLADVGLVGFPSAGKSTLLSVVSNAKPKIAAYHFTTIDPNIGMVRLGDNRDFVMADLPGLIEGASQGVGLGFQFLRHVERTRVILHLVDMSGIEGQDPYVQYKKILTELKEYDPTILERPQIVVATKMDMPDSEELFAKFQEQVQADSGLAKTPEIVSISAVTHDGVDALLRKTADLLDQAPVPTAYQQEEETTEEKIYQYKKQTPVISVDWDDELSCWLISGPEVEKLAAMTNMQREATIMRFARQLRHMGVDDKLREAGAEDGDDVRINNTNFVFEYSE
ncbi:MULTISPECIES: GTPase ObgE [Fructobacillus]|uniref:GTPase Obg n=2 Tax=Fructobacillus TaxID=559173 RepID=A0A3F3H0I9_9LACO|nr:GTPase ObgE [Fructobacillus tropaeoli]CAK1224178.1 GTPase involved in cell partioning and DNA repair (Obg) [Fructobacillus sp. LMG 32999]CAK1232037.1 GTPase involved in cell partioning and DNA repair (Obg) [Fructobacillus sp. LMG 32999]CAK1232601.1 GTPase involved in cell partioning and DNA repair (Obg) [Fructobacillus sp. LMG 32999]CAK1236610.1 GTPase involved in cell partioning and DNA repair (Obg) [Fructobacillus sp. LMG 32999]CAK1237906.1 GTPase involved in cell partioning and DNA repai